MDSLRGKLIRLAKINPDLQKDLLPLLKKAAAQYKADTYMVSHCGAIPTQHDEKLSTATAPDRATALSRSLQAALNNLANSGAVGPDGNFETIDDVSEFLMTVVYRSC